MAFGRSDVTSLDALAVCEFADGDGLCRIASNQHDHDNSDHDSNHDNHDCDHDGDHDCDSDRDDDRGRFDDHRSERRSAGGLRIDRGAGD